MFDLMVVARGTPEFSVADLAYLVNVAALKAAIYGAKAVSMPNLEFAKDKIMMQLILHKASCGQEDLDVYTWSMLCHHCLHFFIACVTIVFISSLHNYMI